MTANLLLFVSVLDADDFQILESLSIEAIYSLQHGQFYRKSAFLRLGEGSITKVMSSTKIYCMEESQAFKKITKGASFIII